MEKGADTLTAFGAECPLIVASIRGHLDIVKFLIETISAEDDFQVSIWGILADLYPKSLTFTLFKISISGWIGCTS